jgi:hypothetical protein
LHLVQLHIALATKKGPRALVILAPVDDVRRAPGAGPRKQKPRATAGLLPNSNSLLH